MFKKRIARTMQTIAIVAAATFFALSLFLVSMPVKNVTDNSINNKISTQNQAIPSDISTQNAYTGTGAPLNLQEWADSKNVTTSRSLIGAGTTSADIYLAEGWTGYKMYTNVYNLYDTVEWAQYTTMAFDGTANGVNNGVWNFARDTVGTNVETGTDANNNPVTGCFVNLNPAWDGTWTHWSLDDNGWWEQIISLPRGQIAAMWIAYDYYKNPVGGFAFSGWEMTHSYVAINGSYAYDLSANNMGADSAWNSVALQQVPQSIINTLNTASGGSACKIQFRIGLRSTQTFQSQPRATADIFYRNVRIFVKALARPVQANLRVAFSGVGGNGGAQNVIQNIGTTFGTGQVNYSATPSSWVAGAVPLDIVSTITTNETRLFPADNLENVQFDMYQVIYGSHVRSTQTGASSLAPVGSNFVAANNSKINWTMYFYDRPPQITGTQLDYTDYTFNGSKPADWTIYSVLDSQPVNKTSNLVGGQNGSTFISMPKAYAAYYGFWTFSAWSRNYVQSMQVPSTIYQGKSLRINGTIISTSLTNSYIGQTKAVLTVKFPNGTVWAGASKVVNVTSPSRLIQFPAITIPTSGSNYIPGMYTAILSWNNSRMSLPLNESGCMVRTFTVFHNATLIPQYTVYWNNVNTQTRALPIELRYVDTGGADISDALITFTNFNSNLQNFTHVNGFYNYLTLLDCLNGNYGLNVITIHATSPEFQPVTLTIQVEVVRTSNFTIDQYPSITSQWNDNFSLVLHYNDSTNHNPIGIASSKNITVNWQVGKYWVNMAQNSSGKFTIVFNTTAVLPSNTPYTVPISIKRIGYQNQTVVMTITITPRLTSLSLVPIPDLAFGSSLNVSGSFKELSSGNSIIDTAGKLHVYAWIIGGPNCSVASLGGGNYRFTLNSALLLNLGKYTLRVDFKWIGTPYYANVTSTLAFNLVQRSTQAYASSTFDTKYWGSNFTIPITYVDVINGSAISGANVHITIYGTDQGLPLTTVNTKTQITFSSGTWNLNFDSSQFGHTSISPGFNIVVFVNWTRNKAPFYVNQTVSFTIKIDQAPTFIYIVDPSKQTVPSGYNNTITFDLINQRSGSGIGNVANNITIKSTVLPNHAIFNPSWAPSIVDEHNGSYVLTFNITTASSDYVAFNISIHMSFYANIVNYSFTLIKIAPVPLLELVKVDQVYLGQSMNIEVFYHLQSGPAIPGATITVQDGPSSGAWASGTDFTRSFDGTNYNVTFTPSFTHPHVNHVGSYTVFINCTSTKGTSQLRVNFVINPIPTAISREYFNNANYTGVLPTYSAFIGDTVNLKVVFKNLFNGSVVSGALVTLTLGAFTDTFSLVGQNYSININTNTFGVGPFIFTVSASKANFQPASQQVKLDIQAVSTSIKLWLNGTTTSTMTLYYSQKIDLKFLYNNTHNNVAITNPSVSIVLTGGIAPITTSSFTLVGNNWSALIPTTQIGAPGTYSMTLTAGLTNYQTALATFVVSISPIPTSLTVYNASGKVQSSYTIYWGKTFSVGLLYKTTIAPRNITGAIMTVASALSHIGSPNGNWYNFTFDSTNIVPNVYQISLSASLANYTSSTTLITVSVLPITTSLTAYNATGTQMTSFAAVYGGNVTVKLKLSDTVNVGQLVPGASWTTSYGYVTPYGGQLGNYTLQVNTTRWANVGIVQFTVTGTKANFTSSSVVITINILPITTTSNVFINNVNRTIDLQDTINYLENFSIVIFYHDQFNNRPIHGASVSLKFQNITGTYTFTLAEVGSTGNYSTQLSSKALGAARQYVFSLSVAKTNYASVAKEINIFLQPIPTALNVTRGGVLIHEAETINVTWSDSINLEVKLLSFLQGNSPLNASNTTVTISAIVNKQTIIAAWSDVDKAYIISFSTSLPAYGFVAGYTSQILVVGAATGYNGDTRSILVNVSPIPTIMNGIINGTAINLTVPVVFYLTQQIRFHISFDRIYGSQQSLAGSGSQVVVSFSNDTTFSQVSIPMVAFLPSLTSGYFEYTLPLSLNTFASGYKEFLITGTLANYQTQQLKIVVDLRKIPVTWILNMTSNVNDTVDFTTSESFNFRIQLINDLTKEPFTDVSTVTVTLTTQWGEIITMTPEKNGNNYTGVFYTTVQAPATAATYLMTVKVDFNSTHLISLYDIQIITNFKLSASAPQNTNYTWVVLALLIGIIVISTWFILYQVRFKYPPMVRKIMDLRRAVARTRDASKIHPSKVKSREENIYNHYAKIINDYSFLQTRDSRYATKAPGYAPTPDGKTSLEWDIPALEGPELPQGVPKGAKKGGAAKGYKELPMPKPAPVPATAETPQEVGEELASAPSFAAPARPVKPVGMPAAPVRPPVKPIGLAALPKPAVAPLKAYRAPAAPAKPAPVAEGAGETHENLYQQLVLLEQKRYKAERSVRDLDAKHNKGLVNDADYKNYLEKINGGLEKIKTQIADIRRKLISF